MIDYSQFAFPKADDYREPTQEEKRVIRYTIYRRDGGKCTVCKIPVREESGSWSSAHLHHIRGGIHRKDWRPENLTILCLKCHNEVHNAYS